MKGDKISSSVGILFAVFILREALRIDLGGIREPGPGFFLFVAGLLLAVCSAIVLFQALRAKTDTKEPPREEGKGEARLVGYILAALTVYALVLEWLGFILATFLLVLLLMRILEPKKWWKIIVTAGLTSVGAYVIFNHFLKSGLPKGLLDLGF